MAQRPGKAPELAGRPLPAVWSVARGDPDRAARLATAVGVPPLVGQVLLNRGVADEKAARAFLSPSLGQLVDPREIPGMPAAAARLREAVRGSEKVLVYGDYDVDGVSGAALLVRFLRLAGARAEPYVPNRLDEGYGLNVPALEKIAADGFRLVVTVDHGTTAVKEISFAASRSMEVIVVDHHLPGESLPQALALVNPWLDGGPGPHPCGVGVAFKLAWAVAMELSGSPRVAEAHRAFLTDALGLVALGTVADVMPLKGENRVLAHFGLDVLSRSTRPGLRALLDVTRVAPAVPTVADVGFKLAPRMNAAGRLGRAELALELLLTDSPERAGEIATILDGENRRRREIEAEILAKAEERLAKEYPPDHAGAIVLGDPAWHAGVVGIVAARMVDRHHRPAAIAAFEGDLGRGSCRTIPGVKLPAALEKCSDLLLSFGGHDAAAGFTVTAERFGAFREAFDTAIREQMCEEHLVRKVRVDALTPLSTLSLALIEELERLAPFGNGNTEPVFATRGVRVAGRPRRMGKQGEHLSFLATDGTSAFRAVGFSMGSLADPIERSDTPIGIAYVPRRDTYRGDGSIELRLADVAVEGGADG